MDFIVGQNHTRSRLLISIFFALAVLSVIFLGSWFWRRDRSDGLLSSLQLAKVYSDHRPPPYVVDGADLPVGRPLLVSEMPTSAFRDNLLSGVKYITTWPANGWSNQVIEYMNMIYIAQLTRRVPILPRFRPVHISGVNTSHLDFGEVFNVSSLSETLGMPILEWREVKDPASETLEELGCWDIQDKRWGRDQLYLEPPIDLKLDISYTLAPAWVRSAGDGGEDPSTLLWSVASLMAFPHWKTLPMTPSPAHQTTIPPDDHLSCCNSLYWGIQNLEDEEERAPAWHAVGRHMQWTREVRDVGTRYIRHTLGAGEKESIPPYVALHVRRGDFSIWCGITYHTPLNQCFAPLSAYARRVEEVKAEILKRTGMRIQHVIVTSDENDASWWNDVSKLGWRRVDHSRTIERYGPWYPIFIDAFIQSEAVGFVGTATSTVSVLARRRVESMGGVSQMVKWGTLGADDH